jgi:peptidoglycan/LPS O-acetylase OafA/YrhL
VAPNGFRAPALTDTTGAKTALGYMPQLDGLRTLAVGAVVLQHFNILSGVAAFGVHLFFVLSGFLITGILLLSREQVVTAGISRTRAFCQFYIRRALRIFYYLVVFAGILVNAEYAREYAPWLLTYTINLKMAAQGWYIANFAHFWSLAVEEQYYLVWPWLILLLPRKWLVPAALAMTAVGPLFRAYLMVGWTVWQSGASGLQSYIATPTALDSLGMGSLIAIAMRHERTRDILRRSMGIAVPVIGLGLWAVLAFWVGGGWEMVLADTASAIFFGWLIYSAAKGFSGITGRILSAAPLVYIGRISYGVYVYHPLVPGVAQSIAPRLGILLPDGVWASFFLYTGLTLLVSTISWYVMERPINDLKRRFAYAPPKEEMTPAAP